jgi:Asp-tRNA(Asn)/Glu-tRNA(Gln) amidotransferase A subunit family amidase
MLSLTVPPVPRRDRFVLKVRQINKLAINGAQREIASGLPIGLQIVGKPFDDETVLKLSHAFEGDTDYHLRRPRLPGLND